jgi:hypothetical protein
MVKFLYMSTMRFLLKKKSILAGIWSRLCPEGVFWYPLLEGGASLNT